MGAEENKKTLFRCIETFNKCTMEWIDTFYSHDLVWKESPSASFPKGRAGGFKEFYAAAEQRLRVFPNCTLRIAKCVAEDDCVVFEQDWKRTISVPIGNIKAGEEIRSKIITFFKLKIDRIIEHTDFIIPMPL
jgi:predicted ester cyclase